MKRIFVKLMILILPTVFILSTILSAQHMENSGDPELAREKAIREIISDPAQNLLKEKLQFIISRLNPKEIKDKALQQRYATLLQKGLPNIINEIPQNIMTAYPTGAIPADARGAFVEKSAGGWTVNFDYRVLAAKNCAGMACLIATAIHEYTHIADVDDTDNALYGYFQEMAGRLLTDQQIDERVESALRSQLSQKTVQRIDTEKLSQAKNQASDDTLFQAILLVEEEWRRLNLHRERRDKVQKLVTSALSSAAEGRFEAAKFILNGTTDAIVNADRQAMTQTRDEINRTLSELMALLSRETARTGQQAGLEYYLEVKRVLEEVELSKGLGKKAVTRRTEHTKQFTIFVPELVTGDPIYDQTVATRLNKPLQTSLNYEALASGNIPGVILGYSKVEANAPFCYSQCCNQKSIKDGDAEDRFLRSIGLTEEVGKKRDFIFFSEWCKRYHNYISNTFVRFNKVTYRPLFPKDAEVWGRAIQQNLTNVRTQLLAAWEYSQRGYAFIVNSDTYAQFMDAVRQYEAALAQVEDLARNGTPFLTPQQLSKLQVSFGRLIGDRPSNLEDALIAAVAYARAAGNPQLLTLLQEAIVFGPERQTTEAPASSEIASLKTAEGKVIEDVLRNKAKKGENLVPVLVNLYMEGKEETVRDIFLSLSDYAQKQFLAAEQGLDAKRDAVFASMRNETTIDISQQLGKLKTAKDVIERAKGEAFKPDYYEEITTVKTHLTEEQSKKAFKRIYLHISDLQSLQRELRLSLGKAKQIVREVVGEYNQDPTLPIREALHDFLDYYRNRLHELKVEFWPYKHYLPAQFLGFKTDENGKQEPITKQDFEVRELALFTTDQQYNQYQINEIVNDIEIEETYLQHYFQKMLDAFKAFGNQISIAYRGFDEYPSFTMSVALKGSIDVFHSQRASVKQRIEMTAVTFDARPPASQPAAAKAVQKSGPLTEIDKIRAHFMEQVEKVGWLDELGNDSVREAELIKRIEATRPRYNDLAVK